jgi:hypothetical protein
MRAPYFYPDTPPEWKEAAACIGAHEPDIGQHLTGDQGQPRPAPDCKGTHAVLNSAMANAARMARMLGPDIRWVRGVSGEGHVIQSVEVRPRPRDSGLVAWEAPWCESKAAKAQHRLAAVE